MLEVYKESYHKLFPMPPPPHPPRSTQTQIPAHFEAENAAKAIYYASRAGLKL